MKSKFSKIMGIGFALVLVASMMLFAIPTAAGPYNDLAPAVPNAWAEFPPTPGALGGWFFDPAITKVGPIAEAINGDLYAYVAGTAATLANPGTNDIFKSTNGGRTWTVSTSPGYFVNGAGGATAPVIDMVCSSESEDILYVTDGNYVYKSVNGGMSFFIIAEDSFETAILGVCGPSTVLTGGNYITSLDVGYNTDGSSYVFIGVTGTYAPAATPIANNPLYPSVLYINEAGYPSAWTDLSLYCFHAYYETTPDPDVYYPGGFTPYSIGAAPDFATSKKIYVAVSNGLIAHLTFAAAGYTALDAADIGAVVTGATTTDTGILYAYDNTTRTWTVVMDDNGDLFDVAEAVTVTSTHGGTTTGAAVIGETYVISSVGITCGWSEVDELLWDCDAAKNFDIMHASRFAFPPEYAEVGNIFIGVAGVTVGGDVYCVFDTTPQMPDALDLNVQGYYSGCVGISDANICSLDIDENGSLIAGAWGSKRVASVVHHDRPRFGDIVVGIQYSCVGTIRYYSTDVAGDTVSISCPEC